MQLERLFKEQDMRPQHHSSIFVSGLFVALWMSTLGPGCSSANEDDDGSGGTGSSTTGASSGADTSASSTGADTAASTSASSTGADTSASATGTGGSSSSGATGGTIVCTGISRDAPCEVEGECPGLVCGLLDIGSRDCTCAGTWDCTSCAYPDPLPDILMPPEEPLEPCEGVVEGSPCPTSGERCALSEEICACWDGFTSGAGVMEWDCDDPPSVWTTM
jgi:hypothetical protein